MSDLTLKYRTLDQHVIYRHKTIDPYTKVKVPEEDEAIWEELVALKVAERDEEDVLEAEAKLAEPAPEPVEEPPSDEEDALEAEAAPEPVEGPPPDAESPPKKRASQKKTSS